MLLYQEKDRKPIPLADIYAESDCQGAKVMAAGIWPGQLAGCTTYERQKGVWKSAKFVYGC